MKKKLTLAALAALLVFCSYKVTMLAEFPPRGGDAGQKFDSIGSGEKRGPSLDAKGKGNARNSREGDPVINPNVYPLYRDDGIINGELLSLAGIPQSGRARFETLVEETWSELSRDFEARAELIGDGSKEPDRKRTYLIPASKEVAEKHKEKLRAELTANFGEAAGRILTPYLSSPQNFAGFGALDTKLILVNRQSMGQPVVMADFRFSDPETGKAAYAAATIVPQVYRRHLGDSFMNQQDDH